MKSRFLLVACFPLFLQAQTTAIPDPAFEEALIDLELDDIIDGAVLTASIDTVRSLNFAFKGIYDMTGIQDFTALEELDLFENYLTELDLTGNPALVFLNCERNTIATINVTGNPNLERLQAAENNLTAIDVSGNPLLFELRVNINGLSALDLTNNLALQYLYCNNNSLTSIDLSLCDELLEFSCTANDISVLDFSNNLQLRIMVCFQNELVTLDLSSLTHLEIALCAYNNLEFINIKNGNNTLIEDGGFGVFANPDLFCVQVDDESYSNENWVIGVEDHTEFNEICGVGIEDENLNQISVYPNPTNGTLFIESNSSAYYRIQNAQGQIVFSGQLSKGTNSLNLENLSNGIYFLGVGEGSRLKKVVVN